jgi:hypothetical protein
MCPNKGPDSYHVMQNGHPVRPLCKTWCPRGRMWGRGKGGDEGTRLDCSLYAPSGVFGLLAAGKLYIGYLFENAHSHTLSDYRGRETKAKLLHLILSCRLYI